MNVSVASASEEQSAVSEEISMNLNKLQDIAVSLSNNCDETAVMVHQAHQSSKDIVTMMSRFKV